MSELEPPVESANYKLRPAKNVERKMIIDGLNQISRVYTLEEYQYVGFGSVYFADFAIFHRGLGIKNMTSIEQNTQKFARATFNNPYPCIKLINKHSSEVLPSLNWKQKIILWLDYEKGLNQHHLKDLEKYIASAPEGSILIVTVNCVPSDPPEERVEKLLERFEKRLLTTHLNFGMLAGWGTSAEYRKIIARVIKESIIDRNGPDETLRFQNLFNFNYQDGPNKMTTFCGIITTTEKWKLIEQCGIKNLQFFVDSAEVFDITVPQLTVKELIELNKHIPIENPDGCPVPINKKDKIDYARIYKYYPTFIEADL